MNTLFCLLGFISVLVLICVLSGSITFIGVVLLAVNPETLQEDTMKIYPNDTIPAAPEGGLDPSRVNYVLYKYYRVEDEQQQDDDGIDDRLLLYKLQCSDLRPQSRVVDTDKSFNLPPGVSIVELGHMYLLSESSITYQINMTLLSEAPPTYCYATLLLNDQTFDEGVEICNSTEGTLTVTVTSNGYISLFLSVRSDANLTAMHMKTNGTVYYYDATQPKAELVCDIDPPTSTECSIPVQDNSAISGSNKVCILAEREYTSSGNTYIEFSHFEYYTASFAYPQVILIILICVGLVSSVCMCGLSISLCTKPGRRLREALHMSSPLS